MSVCRIDIHPLGGIAGDMFAAAMFDAWPALYPEFKKDLASLSVSGLDASIESRLSKGLGAKYFSVSQQTNQKPPRTLQAVKDFFQPTSLDAEICSIAIDIYTLLAEAEAAVHGKTIETIHFHEVSEWDSMVDIVAAAGAIHRVQCLTWRISALPLGGGTITTAHGDIPLPAPATVALLKDYDWIDDGQTGERVTPTGAAIIAYLKPRRMGPAAIARLACVGVGCGTREFSDRANIVRVSAFKQSNGVEGADLTADVVVKLAFEIDDMTAEELSDACAFIRTSEGVVDVSTVAMQGKKGRHSTGVRVLVSPGHKEQATNLCFTVTSTLGVRCTEVSRTVLNRREVSIDGVQVKVAVRPGVRSTAKAGSDDLSAFDSLQQRRKIAIQAEAEALLASRPEGAVDD